jgi:hypothetical protein
MSQPNIELSAESDQVSMMETKNPIVMSIEPLMIIGDLARTANLVEIDDDQLRHLSISPNVITCLRKFGFTEVPIKALAQHLGFNDAELQMLDIFWEPTFNDSWIYLSKKIICEDMGYSTVAHFHADVLEPDEKDGKKKKRYTKGVDWMEVPKTHELVIAWENLIIEKSIIKNAAHKRGPATKYYIARGKAFKKMVMLAGKGDEFRDYFLKMEPLASLLHEFTNGLIKYNSYLEKKLITEQNKRITVLEAQTAGVSQQKELIEQIASSLAIKKNTGWLYIATSQQDLAANHFKIGITENLDRRLDSYSSTFSTPATKVFYCDYWSLHEPKAVEKLSKVILKTYHLKDPARKKQDETYILNYDVLWRIVSHLCSGYSSAVDAVNKQLVTYKEDITKPSACRPKLPPKTILCIEMKITADDQSITIPLDLDEMTEVERADACKKIINGYVRASTPHKAYDITSDEKEAITPKIKIEWTELEKFIKEKIPHGKKGKVKSTAWKRIISGMLAGIKNIDYTGKKAR